jgi:predicted enzyme related to lactoylglutathione lyase
MGQPVVHFEVVAADGAAAQEFYGEVFGWKMNADNPMNYALVEKESSSTGDSVPGGIGQGPDGYPGHVTFYVEVPDVEAALTQIEGLGGTRVMGPETIPGAGVTLGQFRDPQGNLVGLTQAG